MTVGMSAQTDLTESLARAAVAAIADLAPQLEAAGSRLGLLTIELEVNAKGEVTGGVAWPQLRLSGAKLLGASGRGRG